MQKALASILAQRPVANRTERCVWACGAGSGVFSVILHHAAGLLCVKRGVASVAAVLGGPSLNPRDITLL